MENAHTSNLRRAWVVALVLSLAVVASGLAALIIVDGDFSDWDASMLIATSPDNGGNGSGSAYDLSAMYFTNNGTDLFWRVDTHANTAYGDAVLWICMDVDMNTATGTSDTFCQSDLGSSPDGIDYRLIVDPSHILSASTVRLELFNGIAWTTLGAANVAAAITDNMTEISFDLGDINVDSNRTIPSTISIWSTGLTRDAEAADAVIPGPTAVAVRGLSTRVVVSGGLLLGGALLALALGTFYGLNRRRAESTN